MLCLVLLVFANVDIFEGQEYLLDSWKASG